MYRIAVYTIKGKQSLVSRTQIILTCAVTRLLVQPTILFQTLLYASQILARHLLGWNHRPFYLRRLSCPTPTLHLRRTANHYPVWLKRSRH